MGPSFMVPLFVARLIEDLLRTVLSPPKSCLLSSTVKKPYLKDSWDLLDNTACMAWAKTLINCKEKLWWLQCDIQNRWESFVLCVFDSNIFNFRKHANCHSGKVKYWYACTPKNTFVYDNSTLYVFPYFSSWNTNETKTWHCACVSFMNVFFLLPKELLTKIIMRSLRQLNFAINYRLQSFVLCVFDSNIFNFGKRTNCHFAKDKSQYACTTKTHLCMIIRLRMCSHILVMEIPMRLRHCACVSFMTVFFLLPKEPLMTILTRKRDLQKRVFVPWCHAVSYLFYMDMVGGRESPFGVKADFAEISFLLYSEFFFTLSRRHSVSGRVMWTLKPPLRIIAVCVSLIFCISCSN